MSDCESLPCIEIFVEWKKVDKRDEDITMCVEKIMENAGHLEIDIEFESGYYNFERQSFMYCVVLGLMDILFEDWDFTTITLKQWKRVLYLMEPTYWKPCVGVVDDDYSSDMVVKESTHRDIKHTYKLWQDEEYKGQVIHQDGNFLLWMVHTR